MILTHVWRTGMHSRQVWGSKLAFPLILVNMVSVYPAPSLRCRALCSMLESLVPGSVELRVPGENRAPVKQKQRHFTDWDRHSPGKRRDPRGEAAGPRTCGRRSKQASRVGGVQPAN